MFYRKHIRKTSVSGCVSLRWSFEVGIVMIFNLKTALLISHITSPRSLEVAASDGVCAAAFCNRQAPGHALATACT